MVDTVRTVDELLNSLFASGQLPKSITEQDVRDALVSISLETTDLSLLPRSPAGLEVGRLWIDQDKALRLVTTFQPANQVGFVSMGGRGGLFAQGVTQGAQVWPGEATFNASGGLTGSPVVIGKQFGAANFMGAGSFLAMPLQRLLGSGSFAAAGSMTGAAKQRMRASRTIAGAGSIAADGTRVGSITWAAGTNVQLTNNNLRFQNGLSEATSSWIQTTGTSFKTSGKFYIELWSSGRNDQTYYGIANPSFNATGATGDDVNSWGLFYEWDNTSTDVYNHVSIYGPHNSAGPKEDSICSIAIDCDNWKWWTRQDGGTWAPWNNGSQDPATNTGGMAIDSTLRTGGISVAVSNNFGQDTYVEMRPTSGSWTYAAPSGFVAM